MARLPRPIRRSDCISIPASGRVTSFTAGLGVGVGVVESLGAGVVVWLKRGWLVGGVAELVAVGLVWADWVEVGAGVVGLVVG